MRELERESPTHTSVARRAELPALAIVGAGRVGSSLAAAAERAELEVTLAGRDDALEACRAAAATLLCVPDREIERAAGELAPAASSLRYAGHTSGAATLDALRPLAAAGVETFSLHPLQTVPRRDTDLTGSPCAVAGSTAEALATARGLAERLQMRPFEVPEENRAAYHAAAAIASNFLVAIGESAAALLEAAGPEDARELLAPLVLRTAANWSEHGAAALTGPIARGDEETVAAHLEALRERAPELVPVYEALAAHTRSLASGDGR